MRHVLLFTAILSAQFITLQAQSASNEYAMRAFARDFMAAYNRQDITALRAMYTTNTVEDTMDGVYRNYITQSLEDRFTREDVTLLVHHIGVTWSDAEHTFVTTGTYERFGITIVYDIPLHEKSAYRNIMVQENGQWKIARSTVTPIVKTVVYQKISDPAEWKSAFTNALYGSGVLSFDIGSAQGDPQAGYALLEWPAMDVAKTFFEKPDWHKTLPKTGKSEKPVVVFLEKK
ncbi:MAG: nuclear transport factor 2 family protein [Saprospiraceae bacterium]|nr:nuclear transport factor 2 family protein [Saprospiraceae bacterium]